MNLIRNVKLSFEQWKSKKGQMILLTLQIVASFLCIGFIFQQFYSYQILKNQIINCMGEKEIYKMRDMNDVSWDNQLGDKKYNKDFNILLNTVINSNTEILTVNTNYCTRIENKYIDILEVSPEFFSKYQLKGSYDKDEINDNFNINLLDDIKDVGVKPAVVGYYFSKKNKIGDIISDDYGQRYKIIGFLKKGSVYAMPTQSKDLYKMDQYIITPVYIDCSDNTSIMEYLFSCQFFVNERNELNDIENMNNQLKLMDTYFRSYTKQLLIIKNDVMEAIILYGSFGIILLLFSLIGITGMIVQIIQEYQYEYGVNMLCGATIYDIFFRISFQLFIIILVGVLISFIFFFGKKSFINVICMAIVCIIFLNIYGWRKLKSETILQSLRSRQ